MRYLPYLISLADSAGAADATSAADKNWQLTAGAAENSGHLTDSAADN